MKQRIAWITDSTAYIPEDLREKYGIHIVPLDVIFDDGAYEDGVELTSEELYEKIEQSKTVPKTSQPAIGKFVQLYETLAKEYDCAIAVHLSSQLSGTYQTSKTAAAQTAFPVEVVDSQIVSYPITTLLCKGFELAEKGVDYREIAETLRREASRNENYIVIGKLSQLHKGGRLTNAQLILGTLLQIRPIFTIKNGVVELFEKVRTENKAFRRIFEQLDRARSLHRVVQVEILHGNVIDKALELKETIKSKYGDLEVLVYPLSPVLGVHGGQGTIALTWTNEETES
ncbi:DegV family protein [Brevibacillus ruminantium]|uniref:DegV family protein n=1 Tax=Brevibacillus ruminantium TaxID=2950604 RepID=A0ABY4WDL2_9BACL|nr:DegV family protein [Brevibacillus ruminantium]USG64936.1 DegV family protein [Brevibacillus ruminantium]